MDLTTFFQTSVTLIAFLAPVVIGLVQIGKLTGIADRYCPILSLVLGIIFGLFLGSFETTSFNALLGVLVGLTASGVYSGVKTVVQG